MKPAAPNDELRDHNFNNWSSQEDVSNLINFCRCPFSSFMSIRNWKCNNENHCISRVRKLSYQDKQVLILIMLQIDSRELAHAVGTHAVALMQQEIHFLMMSIY